MRAVLADGDADVRGALRLLLTQDLGLEVVGDVTDAAGLWAQVQQARPDLLVIEWRLLDGGDGAVERLRALSPALKVVAISAVPEAQRQALAAGVDGFVSKADAPTRVVAILRAVLHGDGRAGADGA